VDLEIVEGSRGQWGPEAQRAKTRGLKGRGGGALLGSGSDLKWYSAISAVITDFLNTVNETSAVPVPGASIPMGQGGHVPPIFGLGDITTNAPPIFLE